MKHDNIDIRKEFCQIQPPASNHDYNELFPPSICHHRSVLKRFIHSAGAYWVFMSAKKLNNSTLS